MTRITAHQLDLLYRRWKLGSDEEVAKSLGISRNTVKNGLYDLRRVLGAEDTMQASFILRHDLMAMAARAHTEIT
jgi:hypothetical protein